jgi:hypothetical protein
MDIEKLKRHKIKGFDQIPTDVIKVEGRTICSGIHKLISFWNKEELPERWKDSIIVSMCRKGDKTNLVIIENYQFRQLVTKKFLTSYCQG